MRPSKASYVLFSHEGTLYRAKLKGRALETICKRQGQLYPWKRITDKEIEKLKPTILKEKAHA